MNDSVDFVPETCSKYEIVGNKIKYTKSGYRYYKALFAQAGINIDKISTVDAFTSTMANFPLPVEIEFMIEYGASPDADLRARHLSALLSEKFDEADRLEEILDRRQKFKTVK